MKTFTKIHRAKKSLGQNFLKSGTILEKIAEVGKISKDDVILEIGPGKGTLTMKLLQRAGLVIAVEKDNELFQLLTEKFEKEIENKSLTLLNEDILNFDLEKNLKIQNYKIIANIPYNITGAILKKFLTAKNQPKSMVLLLQREVAQRIMGGKERNKESILSISVKAYGKPKIVGKVPARYFSPAPKVDSAILTIEDISRKIFEENDISEEKFWKIVHEGFKYKRKKLSGNLKNIVPREKLLEMKIGDKRAEDLPILDWIALSKML